MAYQGNWKTQNNDLEEDCCPEDCVDGYMFAPVKMPTLIARGYPSKMPYSLHTFTDRSNTDHLKRPFMPKDYQDEKIDSGVEELSLTSDCVDSYRDSIPDYQDGISSIGEVDKELRNLTIEQTKDEPTSPNVSVKRKQVEEVCNSVDEAYVSGGNNVSVGNTCTDVESWFCEQDMEGDTQAHICLIQENIDLFLYVLCMVPCASYLNIQNFNQQSLLHLAVILKLPQVVRKLVARGAVIDQRDHQGNTPLHIACCRGDLASVLALTTPVEPREVKDVPYTVAYRRIPQAQEVMNYEGSTCLHLAARGCHINIVNHLITKCYADINVQEGRGGETILHQAVENNNQDLIKYLLLHRDLHIEATRYDGSTALSLAQGRKNVQLINLLINAGATNMLMEQSIELSTERSDNDSMEECSSSSSEFSYDDFKIGGSLVSM